MSDESNDEDFSLLERILQGQRAEWSDEKRELRALVLDDLKSYVMRNAEAFQNDAPAPSGPRKKHQDAMRQYFNLMTSIGIAVSEIKGKLHGLSEDDQNAIIVKIDTLVDEAFYAGAMYKNRNMGSDRRELDAKEIQSFMVALLETGKPKMKIWELAAAHFGVSDTALKTRLRNAGLKPWG